MPFYDSFHKLYEILLYKLSVINNPIYESRIISVNNVNNYNS